MQINKNLKFIIFCFIVFLSFDSHTDDGFSISAVIETPQVEINGNADDPAIWFNEVDLVYLLYLVLINIMVFTHIIYLVTSLVFQNQAA